VMLTTIELAHFLFAVRQQSCYARSNEMHAQSGCAIVELFRVRAVVPMLCEDGRAKHAS